MSDALAPISFRNYCDCMSKRSTKRCLCKKQNARSHDCTSKHHQNIQFAQEAPKSIANQFCLSSTIKSFNDNV